MQKIIKPTFLLLLIFFKLSIFGQFKIKGEIVNSENIKIPYCTITLIKDSLNKNTFFSDSNGFYIISDVEKGNYSIIFSYINNISDTAVINLNKDIILNINLKQKVQNLNTVEIKNAKPTFTKKGDRFVFTPNKLFTEGANAIDIFKQTPLVEYNSALETISIFNKSNTTILINNKKTIYPKEYIINLLKSLPADNLINIEIITNSGSEYAANNTSGIININIKKFPFEGLFGSINFTDQQKRYNEQYFNGYFNYSSPKLVLTVTPFFNNSINFTNSKNTLTFINNNNILNQEIENTFYRNYTVTGLSTNIDVDISNKNKLSFVGTYSDVNGNSNSNPTTLNIHNLNNTILSAQQTNIIGKDHYVYNFGNMNYQLIFDSLNTHFIDFNFDYNQYKQRNEDIGTIYFQSLNSNTRIETSKYSNYLPQEFINFSERIDYKKNLNKNTTFSAGIQFSSTEVNNDLNYKNFNYITNTFKTDTLLTNNYNVQEKYTAAYFSFFKQFNTQWNATVGLRAEQTNFITKVVNLGAINDSTYLNIFPSLYLNYTPNNSNQFSYSFTRKITRPDFESLFPGRRYTSNIGFTENNPFLKPNFYYSSEFNYILNNNYTFQLTYLYYSNLFKQFTIPIVEDNIQKLKTTTLNFGDAQSIKFTFNSYLEFLQEKLSFNINAALNYDSYNGTLTNNIINFNNLNYNTAINIYLYLSKNKSFILFTDFNYQSPYKSVEYEILNAVSSLSVGLRKNFSKKLSLFFYLNDMYNGSSILKFKNTLNGFITKNDVVLNQFNQSAGIRLTYKLGNFNVKSNKERNKANDELKNRIK